MVWKDNLKVEYIDPHRHASARHFMESITPQKLMADRVCLRRKGKTGAI